MPGKVPAPIGLLVIVLTSSLAPFGSSALVRTNFTCTVRIIFPGSDRFHLHHLDYLPWFGQISPAPLGLFALVRKNFTCTIRITCLVRTSSPVPLGSLALARMSSPAPLGLF